MGVGLWPGGRGLRCRPALFCPASVREVVTAFHLRAALAAPEPVTSDPDGDAGMPVEAGARGENDGFREAGDSGGCGSDFRFLRGIFLGRGIGAGIGA